MNVAEAEHAAEVLLVRHGQTDDNREPIRVQGFRDTPLNDVGRRQAAQAAARLADGPAIGSLYCSDLSRARETAAIIGRSIGLDPVKDPRLREANRGRWEGRLFADIARQEPALYGAWRRAGADFRFPEGESLQDQQDRVREAVEEIRHGAQLPALVVCHGGSIRVLLCLQDPRGLAAFHDFDVPNLAAVPV